MKSINIKLEVEEIKGQYGKKTGEFKIKLGSHEVRGRSREELEAKVRDFIKMAGEGPKLVVVKVQDETQCVMEYQGQTEVMKVTDRMDYGVFPMPAHTFSGMPLQEQADRTLMHMLQKQWQPGQPLPEACPAWLKDDFERWANIHNRRAALSNYNDQRMGG